MTLSDGLRRLAAVVDGLEGCGVEVVAADPDLEEGALADGTVRADLRVRVPVDLETGEVRIDAGRTVAPDRSSHHEGTGSDTGDGERMNGTGNPDPDPDPDPGGNVDEETAGNPSDGEDRSGTDDESAASDEDGGFRCPWEGCDERFDSEHGMKIHRTKAHLDDGSDGEPGEGRPAYRDPERLRAAYAEHDSFPEMRDALGADVSAQTVRRHMMKHGIHDPSSGDRGGGETGASERDAPPADGSPDGPGMGTGDHGDAAGPGETDGAEKDDAGREAGETDPVDADRESSEDGSDDARANGRSGEGESDAAGTPLSDVVDGAPAGLTVADLRSAVEGADTLYEVQSSLGTDRETAQALLEAFDLLELVHGRVSTKERREDLKEEIDWRIRDELGGASA